MRKKAVNIKRLVSEISPGSFLEIKLSPSLYTYARKLNGLSSFAFYNFLSSTSLIDINFIKNKEVILVVSLMMPEASEWPIIGHLPLPKNWPNNLYYWKAEPTPFIDEKTQELVFSPDTQYFLIDYTDYAPQLTPASQDNLRGLPRQSLYLPELIESKLRLHHGVTLQGELKTPIRLEQQPLW